MTDHPVTIEMLEEGHTLLLGQTRSGKTFQLRSFLERLRRADRRVGAIDKLGNHWGLTLSADGARPGLDFVIFGGKRAHVPMTPADGSRLGRLFVERNIPAIFDVSQWHHDEQQIWVADFADAVFRHNEGAIHLSLDEASSWIPQQTERGEAYRAVQRLATQGLGNGIRLILAAQRWSMIDKTSAGMASVVITMRQFGTDDRNAMRKLLPASIEDLKRIEQELASLPAGTGFVWDPAAATLERHAFPVNTTFDSSRTPRHGDTPPPEISVSSELVAELRALLTPPSVEKPESLKSGCTDDSIPNDPGEAFATGSLVGNMLVARDERISELEAQLAAARVRISTLADSIDRFKERMSEIWARWSSPVDAIMDAQNELLGAMAHEGLRPELRAEIEACAAIQAEPAKAVDRDRPPAKDVGAIADRRLAELGRTKATKPEAEPLPLTVRIVEQLQQIAPARLTWPQLASIMGYKPTGGYFRTARRAAIASGELVEEGDFVRADRDIGKPLSRAEALQLWSDVLEQPARALMEALRNGAATKADLAGSLGYSPSGGHFRKGLAILRQNGVTVESGDMVRLAAPLPGEAAN